MTKRKARQAPLAEARLSERTGAMRTPIRRQVVRARYDAAQTTDDNRKHWGVATGLSPDAVANPEVRRILRNRTRYEVRNNSYAKGIVSTLANDAVGTGPRLQMQTGDKQLDADIEQDFTDWMQETRLAEKLRSMRSARCDSGEAFGLMFTNPGLAHDVKLDVTIVEPDQVTDPYTIAATPNLLCDGIEYDTYGNPVKYHVLKYHPGSTTFPVSLPNSSDPWPAKYVLHYFRPDRPGQRRGVPDLTPAVQLFAELRRYCAAVIAAAETAADFAAVIYSEASPGDDETSTVDAMDTVELTKRMATTLPKGWKLGQVKAEQPTTVYGDFVDKKLAEICRCLNVPFTIGALDSSKSNLSARYLDSQTYVSSVVVDRHDLEILLNRLLDTWLTEWIKLRGAGASQLPDRFKRQWFWPSLGHHADPAKVAAAQTARLSAGTSSHAREYARDGLDWESEQAAAAKGLGVSIQRYRELLVQKLFGIPGQTTPSDGESSQAPADDANSEEDANGDEEPTDPQDE